MARTTRARYELITDGETGRPLWLEWLASGNAKLRGKYGEPIVAYVADAGGLPYKTLAGLTNGTRTPTLETLGEIVAAGAYLNGVSEEEARKHIVRLVHRPIEQAEAA